MRYNEPINLKLFTYENGAFTLQAIIDDYQEISFSHSLYEAGDFTIQINYNIPNAQKFQRGIFVQFGNDSYMFGEILKITDAIGSDGKGSQVRTITGKDARYIFKRRIIKNLNNEENWIMTAKGELCIRNLIKDQCGSGAETKRQLPITNTIPSSSNAVGKEYSVAESFSNLYDTLVTIATQSEIGWRVKFDGALTLECFEGSDLSSQVQFSTDFDSLSNGEFTDSAESYANSIYVGGKGTGADRDIYEGEDAISGESPAGLDRYEAWDNQSSMTSESEYEAEALSMLTQYGQTIDVSGNGLAQCPYIFKENYNVGDTITLSFSGKSAKAQILSVTEHWAWGQYGLEFSFGKPQNDLSRQLQLILKQIQKASDKTETTSSVKYYEIPTDTEQPKADVIYNTIGFTGNAGTGATFKLYYDSEKTGAKNYHIWFKQLSGTGKLTLTTGVSGKANLELNTGTYVAIIYVDAEGNVLSQGATPTATISSGNNQPAQSGAVAGAISTEVTNRNSAIETAINALDVAEAGGTGKYIKAISETDGKINATEGTIDSSVTNNSTNPVTSGAVYTAIMDYIKRLDLSGDININEGGSIDNLPYDAIRWYKVRGLNIGWRSQDGMIINIPWSNLYCFQIAVDDETNWMAIRSCRNGAWNDWEEILTSSIGTKFPDYARGNLHTDSTVTSYTPTEDCYVSYIWLSGSVNVTLNIDGVSVSTKDNTTNMYVNSFFGYVKKGSVITRSDGGYLNPDILKVYGLK